MKLAILLQDTHDEARKEGLEEGKKMGLEEGIRNSIKNLMQNAHYNAIQAMDMLGIPMDDRQKYLSGLG